MIAKTKKAVKPLVFHSLPLDYRFSTIYTGCSVSEFYDLTMPKRVKEKTIYGRYREILKKPRLKDEEIDEMRKSVRLLALALVERVSQRETNQIY